MWNKTVTQSLGLVCFLGLASCEKAQDLLAEVTGDAAPTERREGITKVYKASAADSKLWLAEPNVLVVLGFSSETCPPCKAMEPTLEKMAEKYGDKAAVLKLDVGADSEIATLAAEEYKVQKTPTLKFFLNGKAVKTLEGKQTEEKLESVFSRYTGKIDGEYIMKEGAMPGKGIAQTVEEMMVRPRKGELPEGITRVKVPKDAKSVTEGLPKNILNGGALAPVPPAH